MLQERIQTMSQHIYSQGNVEVRMGYDRPLDYVFCTVSIRDEVVYSNLSDEDAGTDCQDVDYYRCVLNSLKIEIPEEMFADVKDDQVHRVGNRVKHHGEKQ
jgi:hypothetical protein